MIFYKSPIKIEFWDGLYVNGEKRTFSPRMLSKLNEVLLSPVYPEEDIPIYLMYKDIYSSNNLRYDITVIASKMIGKEYARTYGHSHPKAKDGYGYPEIYQVLFGEAKFILQKTNKDGNTNVILVSAKKGDVILIPSDYGHVSINTSNELPLFLANVVSNEFSSIYDKYKSNRGPAVYYTKDGVVQNTNYLINNIETISVSEINKRYNFTCSDLLEDFYKNEKKFEFLNKPSLLFG